MDSGLSPSDPTVVAAFRSALLHQGLIAAAVVILLLLAWGAAQNWLPTAGVAAQVAREPSGRRVLRIAFGVLWVFDGILQAQPKMAVGLPSQVIAPAAESSPRWVQDLVNWGGTSWSYHPVQAGAAAVWIQVGLGLWLLVAARGWWSRAAGLASVGWGLVVWVFGEAFGGIFAPGLSWLTGAPGAVLLYCGAGALIALPLPAWRTPRIGRLLLAGGGVYFIGVAVLQAWPGRGSLSAMVAGMAQTSQPHFLSALVSAFGSFDAAHGFAVNLFVVIALAAIGAGLLTGRPRLARAVVIAATVLCLAVWVLVQDFGFLGGLGTDPNSMVPTIALLAGGYFALTRPQADESGTTEGAGTAEPTGQRRIAALAGRFSTSSVAALGAIAVVLIGAAPMAAASADRTADPILAEAIAGYSPPLDMPAPAFRLTDTQGQTVTLASLRGKVVLLTFLDPVCTTDCPLIAQEFKYAGTLLGAQDRQVELVAIAANPTYYSTRFTQAFTAQEGLNTVPNWEYLTGPLPELQQLWNQYGVTVEDLPAGAMSAHNDIAIVIDRSGAIRQELDADPGPGTTSTQSSWAALLAADARQALSQ
jgi:cytochrome oxidase Cu insertion factor (SCO1/SenC/PrrC family)